MSEPDETISPALSAPARVIVAIAQATRFYSRLPVPQLAFETEPHALPDFSRIAWAVPIAGLIIGVIGGLAGALAMLAGLSPMIAASLTLATLVIITGCFHEDGLADACDGLWGGMTPERRLEIMKDSRIGSYGAAGLALSLLIRFAALSELFRLMGPYAGLAIPAVASFSRAISFVPAAMLNPAATKGLAALAPMPGLRALPLPLAIGGAVFAGTCLLLDLAPALWMAIAPLALVLMLAISLMRRKIGGFTGDLLGATQQLAEMALLLTFAAAISARGPF
ncbi:MAG: adenosylcobinamide-GDP ribazoletransferase [Rhizobiales bacterium]|nr:adenosylcobinamide-GDP ribazoletransferase [Hyphomicrobiales bacterium]